MFERGSEWRKWDLHVHTKGTVKNDQFISTNFNEFCDIFFKKALENDIAVIGITDYFNIDNYKKILDFKSNIDSNISFTSEEKEKIKNITIFPNVELRMLPVTSSGKLVNIHCIFNPKYVSKLDNDFFSSIEFSNGQRKYKMNKQGIIDLGYSLDNSLQNDEEKYKKGIENFVVTHGDLQKLFDENNELKQNTIIVVSNSSNDGASGFQKHYDLFEGKDISSLNGVRKSIYCISQLIFSSNKGDRDYFLGKKVDDINTVISKCGSLKPCIHGSDAHKEEKLFEPDNNNFCWIKANPTFEGLKQIIYEPEDRVKIQPNKPEEKTGYQAIDKIEINSDIIVNKEIVFNQNLNSIIGGRSTGKSILLAGIALRLKLDNKPKFEGDSKEKYKEFIESISKDIKIFWKDGREEYEREVEYFQQSYMYELAKNTNELDNVIENILREKGKSEYLDEYNNFISKNSKNISVQVSDLFQIINDLQKIRQLLLELGDKDGVKLEIEKLEKEIKNNTKTEINDSEKQKYDNFRLILEKLEKEKDVNIKDLENIKKLKSYSFIKENIDYELLDILDNNRKTIINNEFYKLKNIFKENFELKLTDVNNNIVRRNLEIDKAIKKILDDQIYKKVLLAFKNSSQMQEIEEKLKIQKNKLLKIEEYINKISNLEKQQNSIIDDIKKLYKEFEFKTIEVVDNLSDDVDGLEIKAKILHKENIYKDILINALDNRTIQNKKYIEGDSTNIFSLFKDIIKGDLSYRSSYNSETLAKRIMSQSLYDISFDLIYENDNFLQMSDGKKAFVVLKLLLDFSNKECPILIDQPEDDLDNRSIYNELVEYIKKKKKQRQIIVATHNPNVVVTADSEEVIVANQHGNGTPNLDQKKFQYISGSLENTKFLDESQLSISILNSQGINEHVCDIVEGGEKAFEQRKRKYNF